MYSDAANHQGELPLPPAALNFPLTSGRTGKGFNRSLGFTGLHKLCNENITFVFYLCYISVVRRNPIIVLVLHAGDPEAEYD